MQPLTPKNVIGPTIRKLRNHHGLTQDALAAKLQVAGWDCTRSWLAKIEARQVSVKDFELLFIAKALGVSLPELYTSLSPRLPATTPRRR